METTVKQIVEEEGDETDRAEVPETISSSPTKDETKKKEFVDLKAIIEDKGARKDWQERELALKAMIDVYQPRANKNQFNPKDILDD